MPTSENPNDTPTDIRLRRRSRVVEVAFADGHRYALDFEYLRTQSPSAEVQGHGPGQDVLQIAKENVNVVAMEPVGRYAIKIVFEDGHDTGLYTWPYLRVLGQEYAARWARYLTRLHGIGYVRRPTPPALTPTE
jgi:DUF971 family protein